MHKLALLVLALSLVGCESKKLSVAGATCSASSDCAGDLQCVASTCIDLAAKAAQEKQAADAQAMKDAEQKKAMDAVLAELKGLKDEQGKLEEEKQELDHKLNNVTSTAEKSRLLAEKAALDAQLADNASKQTKSRGLPESKRTLVKSDVDDPLDGL